jgi:hypothetical protein
MPTFSSPHRSRPPSPDPATQRWRARGFPAHARTAALGGLNLHALLLLSSSAWCRSRGCQQRDHHAHTGKAPRSICHRVAHYPLYYHRPPWAHHELPQARPRDAPETVLAPPKGFPENPGPAWLPPKQLGSSMPATFRATTLAKTDALRRFGRFVLLIQHFVGPT